MSPQNGMSSTGVPADMTIETRRDGHVVEVTFSRPGVLNAFAPGDLPRLASVLRGAGALPEARVVVVRGGGGAFSAGDDLTETAKLDIAGWEAVVEGFHELTRVIRALDVPVICAVDGVCVGGAFEFACSCDLRVATERSRFGCPEVGVGITISNGASVILERLCGAGFAAELMLTGRLIDADEARRRGLVNRVVVPDALDEAIAGLAVEIASRAPLAVRATKRLIVDAQAEAVRQAMERETAVGVPLFDSADVREALAAFGEKRAAVFTGA